MEGMVSAMTVASTPTTKMARRITQMISISDARWRKISLYTFLKRRELTSVWVLP